MVRKLIFLALLLFLGCRPGASRLYLRRHLSSDSSGSSGSGSGSSESSSGSSGSGSGSSDGSGSYEDSGSNEVSETYEDAESVEDLEGSDGGAGTVESPGSPDNGTPDKGTPDNGTSDNNTPAIETPDNSSSNKEDGEALSFNLHNAFCKDDEMQEQHYFKVDIDVDLRGTCGRSSETAWLRDMLQSTFQSLAFQTAFGWALYGQGIQARNVQLGTEICEAPLELNNRRDLWWRKKWAAPSETFTNGVTNPVDKFWTFQGSGMNLFCYPEFKKLNQAVENNDRPDFESKLTRMDEVISQILAQHEEKQRRMTTKHDESIAALKFEMDELMVAIKNDAALETVAAQNLESAIEQERAALRAVHGQSLPSGVQQVLEAEESKLRADFELERTQRQEVHEQWVSELRRQQRGTLSGLETEAKDLQRELENQSRLLDVQRGKLQTERDQWEYLRDQKNRDNEERQISHEDFYLALDKLERDAKEKAEREIGKVWDSYRMVGLCADDEPVISRIALTPVQNAEEASRICG